MGTLYSLGLILSAAVGLWHFTVPYMFQWYSYIPHEYENLIVSINYVNIFFSLLLSGYSLLLLFYKKKIFHGNKELLVMYGFMVFVWLCRTAITFIEPVPLKPAAWIVYAQQIGSFTIFLLQFIPLIYILKKGRKT